MILYCIYNIILSLHFWFPIVNFTFHYFHKMDIVINISFFILFSNYFKLLLKYNGNSSSNLYISLPLDHHQLHHIKYFLNTFPKLRKIHRRTKKLLFTHMLNNPNISFSSLIFAIDYFDINILYLQMLDHLLYEIHPLNFQICQTIILRFGSKSQRSIIAHKRFLQSKFLPPSLSNFSITDILNADLKQINNLMTQHFRLYKQSLKCQSIPIDFDNTYCRVCHASLKHCRPKFKKLDPLVHLFLSRTPCCHTPHHIFCSYDTIQNGFKICKLCLHAVKCFNWKLITQYMLEPK